MCDRTGDARDLAEAMGQIVKCHALLDSRNIPHAVPCLDGKPGALHNRLITYIELKDFVARNSDF